jgi:hypothetical protein
MYNKKYIIEALNEGGYPVKEYERGQIEVNGYKGNTLHADFKICTSANYDIGFSKNTLGHYELVADWYELKKYSSKLTQENFIAWLKRQYARATIEQTAKNLNLTLGEITEYEDGQIQIMAYASN